jgi:hypothetical protein
VLLKSPTTDADSLTAWLPVHKHYNKCMSYATEISKTLTETLARFATLNPHQLAGHVANMDFWLSEVRHCIEVLNGYGKRFEAMTAAQKEYVAEWNTLEYPYLCNDYCPICAKGQTPTPPRRVPHGALKDALQGLRDAAYRFLVRCYQVDFIDEARLRAAADSIGTGVDLSDLKR